MHVSFVGETNRAWVDENRLKPFSGLENFKEERERLVGNIKDKVDRNAKKPLIQFLTHPSKTLSAPPAGFTAPPTTSPAALHVLFPGPCRHMEARTPGEPSRVFPVDSHWSAQF